MGEAVRTKFVKGKRAVFHRGAWWIFGAKGWRPPPIVGGTHITPSLSQIHFRHRADDGSETAATWLTAEDTNWTKLVDTNFRVRFTVDETAGGAESNINLRLQYNRNAAGWNDVTSSSAVVRAFTSTHYADEAATTRQLTAPLTVFVTGAMDDGDGLAGSGNQIDFTVGGEFTEVEYCIQIVGADVTNNDTIQLRVVRSGGTLDAWPATPTVTVDKPAAPIGGEQMVALRGRAPSRAARARIEQAHDDPGSGGEAQDIRARRAPARSRQMVPFSTPPDVTVQDVGEGGEGGITSRVLRWVRQARWRPFSDLSDIAAPPEGELKYEVGAWTANGSSPQTITLQDTGFGTPIAIEVWTQGWGAVAAGFQSHTVLSAGFATRRGGTTQQFCIGALSEDNAATSRALRRHVANLAQVNDPTTGFVDYTVSLTSFGNAQFTVSYSSAANASGDTFYYRVLGGSALTDAIVLNHVMDSTGATEIVTGTGFPPTVMAGLYDRSSIGGGTTHHILSYGWASSSSRFWCVSHTASTADVATGTMNWNKSSRTDAFIEGLSENNDMSDCRWDLDSLDADGATLGVIDAPSRTTDEAILLFIQGGTWEAGTFTKPASTTGDQTVSLINGTITPTGVILATIGEVSTGVVLGDYDLCVGSGSTPSTTRGSAGNNVSGATGP